MIRALFFCLLSALAAYGQGRYFRIVEGDRYEYWYQDTSAVGGTIASSGARDGKASVLVADVHGSADSLWFTLRVRDSSLFICLEATYNCTSYPTGARIDTFSTSLLYARGQLFVIVEPYLEIYYRFGEGNLNGFPRFLADTVSFIDSGDPEYRSKVVRIGRDVLRFTDPIDTSYYLAGFGLVYDKRSSWIGFQRGSEKFALISFNGVPFRLEDHLTVGDPVPIREYSRPKRSVDFHFPNIDLLGRRIAIPGPAGRGPFAGFLFR